MIYKFLKRIIRYSKSATPLIVVVAMLVVQAGSTLQAAPSAQFGGWDKFSNSKNFFGDGGFETGLGNWSTYGKDANNFGTGGFNFGDIGFNNHDKSFQNVGFSNYNTGFTDFGFGGKQAVSLFDGAGIAQTFAADPGDKFTFDVFGQNGQTGQSVVGTPGQPGANGSSFGVNFFDDFGNLLPALNNVKNFEAPTFTNDKVEAVAPAKTAFAMPFLTGATGGTSFFDNLSFEKETAALPTFVTPEKNLLTGIDFDTFSDNKTDTDSSLLGGFFDSIFGSIAQIFNPDFNRDVVQFSDGSEFKKEFDAAPGDIFELSGLGKADVGKGAFGFNFLDDKGGILEGISDIFDFDGFEEKKLQGVAPIGTNAVEFFTNIDSDAKVEFDDLFFTQEKASAIVPDFNAKNLLGNGGFEIDFDDWDIFGQISNKLSIDANAFGGKNAANLIDGGLIRQTLPAKFDDVFTLGVHSKADVGKGEFGLRFLDDAKGVLQEIVEVTEDKDFGFGRIDAKAPVGTSFLEVFGKAGPDSQVTFDNFSVVQDVKSVIPDIDIISDNLLKDADFEFDFDLDNKFDLGAWSVWEGTGSKVEVTEDLDFGSKVLDIINDAYVFQSFPAIAGDTFTFNASGFGNGLDGADGAPGTSVIGGSGTTSFTKSPEIGVNFLDGFGNSLGKTAQPFAIGGSTKAFQPVSFQTIAPFGTKVAQPYIQGRSGMNLKVDNIEFIPDGKQAMEPAITKLNGLLNSDFENLLNAWTIDSKIPEDVKIVDQAFSGDKAVELLDAASIFQVLPAKPGTAYSFNGMGQKFSGSGEIGLEFLDEFENILERFSLDFTDDAFEKLDVIATAPTKAESVRPFVRVEEDSKFTFDDLNFIEDIDLGKALDIPVPNLLVDNSFEKGFADWQIWNNKSGVVDIIEEAVNGKQSVRLQNQAQIFQAFPAIAGETFGLSGWGKKGADGADGLGSLGVRFLDKDGNRLSDVFEGFQERDFEFKDLVATAPAKTSFVQPYAWADPGVTIDLDDLNFIKETPAKLTPSFPTVNILPDADFEQGLGVWDFLGDVDVIDAGFSGEKAALLPELSSISQKFPAIPGESFSFTGIGKADQGNGILGLNFLDDKGLNLGTFESNFFDKDFAPQNITAVAPPKTAAVQPFFQTNKGSQISVDTLSFSKDGFFDNSIKPAPITLDKFPIISPISPRRGDVSCDGGNNSVDALVVLQYDVGLRPNAGSGCVDPVSNEDIINLDACDVDDDGRCSAIDAMMYLQCDLGRANKFCPQQ